MKSSRAHCPSMLLMNPVRRGSCSRCNAKTPSYANAHGPYVALAETLRGIHYHINTHLRRGAALRTDTNTRTDATGGAQFFFFLAFSRSARAFSFSFFSFSLAASSFAISCALSFSPRRLRAISNT